MRTVAQMKAADYTEIMPDTCDIKAYTSLGNDRLNKPLYEWTVETADVSCRREVLSERETTREFIGQDQKHVTAEYRFYLESGTTVTERNRLTFDGEDYEILYVAPFQDIDSAYTQEVWCVRMK